VGLLVYGAHLVTARDRDGVVRLPRGFEQRVGRGERLRGVSRLQSPVHGVERGLSGGGKGGRRRLRPRGLSPGGGRRGRRTGQKGDEGRGSDGGASGGHQGFIRPARARFLQRKRSDIQPDYCTGIRPK